MKSPLISVLAMILLFSFECNKSPTAALDSSKSVIGRWERYDSCSGSGTPSRYSYLFREKTFLVFNGSICPDSFLDYSARNSGFWSGQGGFLDLSSDSLYEQNAEKFKYDLSENDDTLYLTDTNNVAREFHRLPACYLVNGYCDGMVFQGRLGDNFPQAVDSLLKRYGGQQASSLAYDSLTLAVRADTVGNPYTVPCFSICIHQNSSSTPINSCGDVIDSLGNWYGLEICQ